MIIGLHVYLDFVKRTYNVFYSTGVVTTVLPSLCEGAETADAKGAVATISGGAGSGTKDGTTVATTRSIPVATPTAISGGAGSGARCGSVFYQIEFQAL